MMTFAEPQRPGSLSTPCSGIGNPCSPDGINDSFDRYLNRSDQLRVFRSECGNAAEGFRSTVRGAEDGATRMRQSERDTPSVAVRSLREEVPC